MAKGLRNYPKHEQREVVRRRLEKSTGGLGYWAAVDYQERLKKTGTEVGFLHLHN